MRIVEKTIKDILDDFFEVNVSDKFYSEENNILIDNIDTDLLSQAITDALETRRLLK